MAIQPEKAFCVLEFHSTKSVINVQQEFRRKFEKDPPIGDSIKCYNNLCKQLASLRKDYRPTDFKCGNR